MLVFGRPAAELRVGAAGGVDGRQQHAGGRGVGVGAVNAPAVRGVHAGTGVDRLVGWWLMAPQCASFALVRLVVPMGGNALVGAGLQSVLSTLPRCVGYTLVRGLAGCWLVLASRFREAVRRDVVAIHCCNPLPYWKRWFRSRQLIDKTNWQNDGGERRRAHENKPCARANMNIDDGGG